MYYRLVKAIETPFSVRCCVNHNGHRRYGSMTLDPGKTYTTNGDKFLEESLREFTVERTYTKSLDDSLSHYKIPFKVKACGSCSGRSKSIVYHPVEVFM